jgi:hypothetical protein
MALHAPKQLIVPGDKHFDVPHGGSVMLRFVFRHLLGGEVVETDLIESSLVEWADSKESADPRWSVFIKGRKVRALRLPAIRLHTPGTADPERLTGFGGSGNSIGEDEG